MTEKYIKLDDALRALCADCFWKDKGCRKTCRDYRRLQGLPAAAVEPVKYASWEIVQEEKVQCTSCGLTINVTGCTPEEAIKRDTLPRRCACCGAHIVFDFKKENDNAEKL